MNSKMNFKRIVALLGAIILILMFVATLVVAVLNFEGSDKVLSALIGCDVLIPVILWGYLMVYKWASNRDERLNKELDKIDEENANK